MAEGSKKSSRRLYKYIVRQKKLIWLGILSTLLMSFVELFTGSLLKFLTKLAGKFAASYESGFEKGIKLPVKYKIEMPLTGDELTVINTTLKGNDGIFAGMLWLCLTFLGLFFLLSLFNYGRRVFMNAATQKILLDFKSDIYKKVLRLPFSFFSRNKTGDVVSRITYDVTTLNEIIDLFIEVARAGIYILVFLPFMFAMSWQLSIFTLLFFPLSVLLIEYVTRYIKRVGKKITDNVGDYTAFLEEKINRFKLIKGYSTEKKEAEVFDKLVEDNYKYNLKLIKLKFSMNPTNDFLAMVAVAIVYLFFSYKLTNGKGSVGDIVFYLYLMKTLFKPVKKVAQAWGQLHVALVSTRKIFNLLDETEEDLGNEAVSEIVSVDSISFKNVSFAYPDDEREILKDIDFVANKGDVVSLEGMSGAGKSTVLKLIPAFYSSDTGSVMINNAPIGNYSLGSIRSKISIVDSDNKFMNDTIRANIQYSGNEMTPEQEVEFTSFIGLSHTCELDLVIGKDGVDLSEGQKQKLSFVRAIINNPSVIILDEAFSLLDENDISYIMDNSKKADIVFVVSRKQEVAKYANKRILVSNGVSEVL